MAYLNIREGDYWSPEVVESVPMVVVDPSKLEVNLELPAFDEAKVRPGQKAYIVRDADLTQASVKGLSSENLIQLAQAEGEILAVNPAVTPGGRAVNARIRIAKGKENLRVGELVVTEGKNRLVNESSVRLVGTNF